MNASAASCSLAVVLAGRKRWCLSIAPAPYRLADAPPAGLWDGDEPPLTMDRRCLRLEAHLQLTNRCEAGCATCYTGASPQGSPHEWGLPEWCAAIDELSAAGVFHVALGGGESAHLPWFGELLAHCWQRGVIPNLTTSGLYADDVRKRVQIWRGADCLDRSTSRSMASAKPMNLCAASMALRLPMKRCGRSCGCFPMSASTPCSRVGFPQLAELFDHAKRRGASEIELLRLKPAGRGASPKTYEALRCTDEQHRGLVETVLSPTRTYGLRTRLDCSLVPFVAHKQFDAKLLRFLSIYGCAGGDLLTAARADGRLSACSFAVPTAEKVTDLRRHFADPAAFPPFRAYLQADEPCRSLPLSFAVPRRLSGRFAAQRRQPARPRSRMSASSTGACSIPPKQRLRRVG